MTGRTVVVTGANSGIGRVTARVCAERVARVVCEVRELDLADLTSVRVFAQNLTGPIDLLINNAGVSLPPLSRTADDFEMQFGTNHLGHFALTNLLLPQIRRRVVTVASLAHFVGSMDFADLNWERKRYRANPAYGQSKLANLLFTAELQRRLSMAGSAVIATAAHPGISATNLMRSDNPSLRFRLGKALLAMITQSADDGALATLYAATADVAGNSYAGPSGLMGLRGAPTLVGRSTKARDAFVARRLWEASERLTGVSFPLVVHQAS